MHRKITLLFVLTAICFTTRTHAQCPPNIDFEYGNFTNWTCYTGTCCPIVTPTTTPPVNGRHNIMSGATTDYYGGFPIVSPGGGSYSARVGYDTNGLRAEKIRYYVDVPPGVVNYCLVYRYAIVLEFPSGHAPSVQPRFEVNAYDSATSAPIPCGAYSYVSSSGLPGFVASSVLSRDGGGADVLYRDWNTATLNLTGLGGTTVAIDFAAGDCGLGAHFGYGYVDMSCGLFQVQGLTCDDTATTLTLSAPFGFEYYTWYDSATFTTIYGTTRTITIPIPGGPTTFAVVLTPYPGYGCPDTLYTKVSPSHLRLNPTHDTIICSGSSITLTSGATDIALPLTYSWSPSTGLSCTTCANPIATPPLGTTVYSVTVTNVVGCVKDTTISVTASHVTSTLSKVDDTCAGYNNGSATVNVLTGIPPFYYLWNTTPPQTTAIATGLYGNGVLDSIQYTVIIRDSTGCADTESVWIKNGPRTVLRVLTSRNPDSCNIDNGTITLDSLIPGNTFIVAYLLDGVPYTQTITASAAWTGVLTGLAPGTYTNIRIITTHCPYNIVGPVVLVGPPLPADPVPTSNSPVCVGYPLNLTATSSPGVSYTWTATNGFTSTLQNPTITPANFSDSGLYTVVVMINNCYNKDSVRVRIKPSPIPSASSNSTICSGDTLKLYGNSSNGATLYIWTGPNGYYSNGQNPFIAPAPAAATGTYTLTVVLNGCVKDTTTDVTVFQTPGPPIPLDTEYCQQDPAGPLLAIGTNLLWYQDSVGGTGSTLAPIPSTAVDGIFTWYVSQTSNGCEGPRTPITAQIDYLATPIMLLTDSAICKGGDITFTAAQTGYDMTNIKWTFSDGHQMVGMNPVVHNFDGVGTFTVTASAFYKVCPEKDVSKTVYIFPAPNVYLGSDTSICPGSEAIIVKDYNNAGNPAARWRWNTGSTSSFIRVVAPGTYFVKVTIDGCESTDTITVAKDCYLDLPNVFTPNGDGMNDYFFPRDLLTRGLTSFNMRIYNRWGEEIFTSNSLDGRGWDGRYNDVPQPQGVYVYIIDATFKDGQKEHHQGNVTLLR